MTIVTKKGDGGQTALRYGRAVSKTDLRVEAYGTIDELSSAIGFAKALAQGQTAFACHCEKLNTIQAQLLNVGGDLATSAEDHLKRNNPLFQESYLPWLETEVKELEALVKMTGFILPGVNPTSGAIHLARTVARRAERNVLRLLETEENPAVGKMIPYLNRLSDYLWLLGERIAQS